MDRGDITVGGIVTNVRESMTKKGKPCGFVMLEDFEGSGEIALYGEAWGRWRGMFSIGASVYIKAQITQMYAGSNFYDFNISDIQYLQTVKDKRIEKLTIVIDSHKISTTLVTDLCQKLSADPGPTHVYVQLDSIEDSRSLTMRSKGMRVNVTKDLLSFIKENEALEYLIN